MGNTPHNRIVVGLDGSPSSEAALAWSIAEAVSRGLSLHLVEAGRAGAAAQPPDASPTEALSGGRARAEDEGASVTTEVATGSAAARLVELSEDADTVVVGSRGHGTVRGTLFGSVSLQVAMHAQCPVVIVHEQEDAGNARHGVVVGVESAETSDQAVGYAFSQAAARDVDLTAVHAWVDAPERFPIAPTEAVMTQLRHDLSEALAVWAQKFPDVVVHEQVTRASALDALTDLSERAELVVVGTRGRGGFPRLMLGSTSYGLVPRAHCPVAVVRARANRG